MRRQFLHSVTCFAKSLDIALRSRRDGFRSIMEEIDVPGGAKRLRMLIQDGGARDKTVRVSIGGKQPKDVPFERA